jgi:uncharacterized protein
LITASNNNCVDIAQMLLDRGAKTERQDRDGMTALLHAATKNYFDIFNMLLDHGANIDHCDNSGQTALMCLS